LSQTDIIPGEPEQIPPDQTTAAPGETGTPPASGEPTNSVTLGRDDYDRLQQAAAVAEKLGPIAKQLEDPMFLERLRTAATTPVIPEPATDFTSYNDTFWQDPARSSAEVAERVVREKFEPQVQRAEQRFQLQMNKMAMMNFRNEKRGSDDLYSGVSPIFESLVKGLNDEAISRYDTPTLENMLRGAYDVATGQYLRARRSTQMPPKDSAPPIAGSPVGGSAAARPVEMPDNDETRSLRSQAAAIGKDEAWVAKMWAQSRDEEVAANA
jgi:hypothetical protein